MTTTTTRRPSRGTDRQTASGGRLPLLPLLAVGIALLAVVAVLAGTGDDTGGARTTAPVTVTGEALPPYVAGASDPAAGLPAPALAGTDLYGNAMDFSPGEHPTVLLFAAHWCGHCQAEVKALAPWLADGGQGQLSFMTISTAVDPAAPNYPPAAWFDREEWPAAVLTDSSDSAAAAAFGLSGYPFFVFVDADGRVVGRLSGELGPEALEEAMASLVPTAP